MPKQTAFSVPSLHWMADLTRHDTATLYLLILCSSLSLNPYKHIFHAFCKFSRSTQIVLQYLASLPSWKSLLHFYLMWAGVCPCQEAFALSALPSSNVYRRLWMCTVTPCVYTYPETACAGPVTRDPSPDPTPGTTAMFLHGCVLTQQPCVLKAHS